MSKKIFTEKEIKQLSTNKYVKSVSSKGITYTDEFKHIFIAEKEKGNLREKYLNNVGLMLRSWGWIEFIQRVKDGEKLTIMNGIIGLRDTRAENSGRPRERELTLEEKNARLEAQINLLKAENELLKKIRFAERGMKK